METNENRNSKQEMNLPENASGGSEEKQEQGKKGLLGAAKSFGSWAARAAGNVKNAAVKAIDRNGDGKLDKEDIAEFKARMDEKKEKSRIEREQNRLERELKNLQPIFEEDITSPEFVLPKLLRLAEIDEAHAKSEVCKNSIGFKAKSSNDVRVLTIYPWKRDIFGLKFYPNQDCEIYYVDPFDRDSYIALDEYFKFPRLKKVNELQLIAQALGAKHFKVTFVEQIKEDDIKKSDISAKISKGDNNISAESSHESMSRTFHKVTVAAEMECLGHEPVEPKLVYLKGDPGIERMIQARLSKNSLVHEKVTIELMSFSGIKESDAAKIDNALYWLNFSAKRTLKQEAQTEARTTMEYEIDY